MNQPINNDAPGGRLKGPLTVVSLLWIEKRTERWIRFGHIAQETIIDRRRRLVSFAPGSIFALVRWASNGFGTVVSRIDILRAVTPDEPFSTIPFVAPGAEILLHISGWPKVERVLATIDRIETLGIRAEDVCPDHWRHVTNRLSVNEEPHSYTQARHAAWLKRRELAP